MAGYSGTPLATKLGINVGATVALVNAPDGFTGELPDGVVVRNRARGQLDVVVAFFTHLGDLERRLRTLSTAVFPAGGLWVAWPKKTSGVETDMTDQAVRGLAPSHRIGRQQGVCHRRDLDRPQAGLATGEPILRPALTAIGRSG